MNLVIIHLRDFQTVYGLMSRLFSLLLISLAVFPVSAAVVDEFNHVSVIKSEGITTMPLLIKEIESHQVVIVGETHSSVEDHMLQMHVLETMASQDKPLVMAVEWFQRPFQSVLDQYIAGDIDERQLLRDTEYYHRWGFDYRLYRPMMRFARKAGIRVLALNIRREVTDSVMRNGINGLSEEYARQLPADYDLTDSDYTRLLESMFGGAQGSGHMPELGFQRFMEVQLTWDEVMAETAASYLQENPGTRMVVFTGRGHMHPGAIPTRLYRRTNIKNLSLVNYSPVTPFNHGDYLVLGQQEQLPPAGSMGISVSDRGEKGVYVDGISPQGNASEAGINKGDRILAIDDVPVGSFSDMKYALIDTLPGDRVHLLLLRRPGESGERALKVQLELVE